MNNTVKIALYVFLTILASISGYYALSSFNNLMERSGDRHSDLEQIEPERKLPAENTDLPVSTNAGPSASTSNVAAATMATNTNQVVAQVTNEIATPAPASPAGASKVPAKPKATGRLGLWSGLFIASVITLGLLIASDVSHFLGNRALKTLYNEEGDGIANPEYEKAEQLWANGQHLEAVSLMREYLNKNPREQHVSIRIAEIYEKDLGNNLAAALEYEEVLKHKLAPERWGWAAIHLCNLYFKLNQEQKAYPLLRRIVNEHPNVPAADKARKRLEQVDGAATDQTFAEPRTPPPPPPAATGTSLPPGFRPRK